MMAVGGDDGEEVRGFVSGHHVLRPILSLEHVYGSHISSWLQDLT